jgi:UDP-N-acetylglucosamine/UDP-N-acetylgalactosamine diphosphorylase
MIAEKALKNVKKLLKKHNQSHLLSFWERLNPSQKQNLLAQIEQLDFSKIDLWVTDFVKKSPSTVLPADFAPPPSYSTQPTDTAQRHNYARARELGRKLISAGKVAALTVAGGQATRLGFDGPKGNLPISPLKDKTLFQLFAESIIAVSKRYHTICPWYIMTSPSNHAETEKILRSNDYYGLKKSDVFIFQQGTMPDFSFDGKILLADMDSICCSPDGHGGTVKALYQSGALQNMNKRGVEFISYFQVDNPLVNIFDPLFIGLHALDDAQMSSKAVLKTSPEEKVGVFCSVNGKLTVIEYSDLPKELTEKRNPDGSLVFRLGSIAVHIINTSFIEKLNTAGSSLPLHRAVKKIPHIDRQGNFIDPIEPNGIKLESFIFDALPLASRSVILQTERNQEFAPVKNAAGADSPQTARKMMIARAADWLESAGATIPKKPDGSIDATLEIAPGFALEKDDVKAKLAQIPEIKPKDNIYLSCSQNQKERSNVSKTQQNFTP